MAIRSAERTGTWFAVLLAACVLAACGGAESSDSAGASALRPDADQVFPSERMRPLHDLQETWIDPGASADAGTERAMPAAAAAVPRYLTPALIRSAYGLPSPYVATDPALLAAGQTIAIVAAFANPGIEADLAKFTQRFALPACSNCFTVVNTRGGAETDTPPPTAKRWAIESSLDVQWARAIAPQARIVLVQAASDSYAEVLAAARYAATHLGADVVSMSFGGSEWAGQAAATQAFFADTDASFVAASGDGGYGVLYPAASPGVLAVGGTTLSVSATGVYQGEVAWALSGGGLSAFESALPQAWPGVTPVWQLDAWRGAAQAARGRPVPDVAYAADPAMGFLIYSSVGIGPGYVGIVGGTSAGAPQWAALVAVANARRIQAGKAPFRNRPDALGRPADVRTALMQVAAVPAGELAYGSIFRDIIEKGNGNCADLCSAGPGWDLVTGMGTPNAGKLLQALVRW